jgi:hypothetical protein
VKPDAPWTHPVPPTTLLSAAAEFPPPRKRTRTEAIAHSIARTASKIDDLAFPSFTAEDRAILSEAMNALKDILEPAITRVVNNRGKAT